MAQANVYDAFGIASKNSVAKANATEQEAEKRIIARQQPLEQSSTKHKTDKNSTAGSTTDILM